MHEHHRKCGSEAFLEFRWGPTYSCTADPGSHGHDGHRSQGAGGSNTSWQGPGVGTWVGCTLAVVEVCVPEGLSEFLFP